MSSGDLPIKSGVVRPIDCLKDGWALIKNDYWMFLGVTIAAVLIGGLFVGILWGPMMCGLFLCLLGRQTSRETGETGGEPKQPPSMARLFKGFDHFPSAFVATLLMIAPMIVILVPLYIMIIVTVFNTPQARQPGGSNAIAIMFGFFDVVAAVVSLTTQVLFYFAYPLIADRGLSGPSAVRHSIRAAFANPGGVVGLVLLNAVLGGTGLCVCCVGTILVMPLNYAAAAAAYRRVFPAPL